jgi:hypothetical protein
VKGEERTCVSCGAPLEALHTTVDGASTVMWECAADGCELCHSLQPVEGNRAGGGPLADGRSRTRRLGAEPSNEGNLSRVSKHLETALPKGYRVVSENLHPSVDLAVDCLNCLARRNIQVVRGIDPELAREAARSMAMVWKDGPLQDRWEFVLKAIEKKTALYSAKDRQETLLLVDPEVDLALVLLFVKEGRSPREAALSHREQLESWHGVAVLSFPRQLTWLSTRQSLLPCDCGKRVS